MKNPFSIAIPFIFLFLLSPVFSTLVQARGNGPVLKDSVRFRVNMSYMVSKGSFNPSTDTVLLRSLQLSDSLPIIMHRVDSSYIYQSTFFLTTGLVYYYKFSIFH